MNVQRRFLFFLGLTLLAVPPETRAQEDDPSTRVFDTVAPLSTRLSAAVLREARGWRQIPEDAANTRFQGDALLLNDKLVLAFSAQEGTSQVYARVGGQLVPRATLGWSRAAFAAEERARAFTLVENTSGGVRMDVKAEGNSGLTFRLTTGEPIVEVKGLQGIEYLQVRADSPYVVVPDYFGDDLVYGMRPYKGLLPAENFAVALLQGGDAMLMTVWQSPAQDVTLNVRPNLSPLPPAFFSLRCLKDTNVWLAFLEGQGIWHAQKTAAASSWKAPFPAKWRASALRTNEVADSWDAEQGPAPEQGRATAGSPVVTYLMDRSVSTPLTAICPTDVMRNTLGVGPCQYILACEGMGAQGDPTPNTVMGWVEKQFEQNKQRRVAADIRERLGQMARHVTEAHARIQHYAQAASRLNDWFVNRPELAALQPLAVELAEAAAPGLAPKAAPARAQELSTQVLALLEQDNAAVACRQLGQHLRLLGSIQDRALAKSRMTLRRVRQEARTRESGASSSAEASELRQLAEKALQNQ